MTRNVFARYLTAFTVIIFVTFSILALVIGSNLAITTVDEKSQMVKQTSVTVAGVIQSVVSPSSPETAGEELLGSEFSLKEYLTLMSDYDTEMMVFVTDVSGNVIISDSDVATVVFNSAVPSDIMQKIAVGEQYREYDSMAGALSSSYLYNGCPVYSSDGSTVVCAVFACASSGSVRAVVAAPLKTLIMASLWVFLAALIAVYFITERITSPLKNMSHAAKSFAAGKFDVRVEVSGNDEVAELAAAFNAMAESLRRAEEMRNTFLANVSHDLKTPMTTISGFIDAILVGAIPPDQQNEYLERIKNEVLRLSRLVRQLLDLSRVQAGERKFEFVDFDICETARQILLSFEQKIDEKRLEVEFDCDEFNLMANADKDAIHQIFYNLCDNAVKFSRENGLLRISIKEREKDKKIIVSVFNEGVGIPEEDIPFVFERFYKTDKSRGLDKTGVGLGLYISRTIINAHGEEIHVESNQGENCRFWFTLKPALGASKEQGKLAGEKNGAKSRNESDG
ncbi:MAG: HAMP domain-containing histidine kinase [Clostridia bacterium]|nr:HAMP domain-containing histidine kinase [Clostridia bacterium]